MRLSAEMGRRLPSAAGTAGGLALPTGQQQLWCADQLGDNPGGYLIPLALRFTGELNVDALSRALAEIVARHEVLRTSILVRDARPVGVLRQEAAFTVGVQELSAASLRAAGGIDGLVSAELAKPIDLASELPIRASIWRLGRTEHVLCISVHHVAFDDWSRSVLYNELTVYYEAFRAGARSPLPALDNQYRSVAVKQDELFESSDLRDGIENWHRAVERFTPFELPPDYRRPARRAGRGDVTCFTVPVAALEQLSTLGRRAGATLAMVLYAACRAVFYRYTGRTDVSFGTTSAMRDEPESQRLIGFLVNLILLPGDTSGNPTFTELLKRERELELDAYELRGVPFSRLVGELMPERDPSRTPLFQILVDVSSRRASIGHFAELEVTEMPVAFAGSKFDISIWFSSGTDGLRCEAGWDSALYERATIERLMIHLRNFLVYVADCPQTPIDLVPLASPDEQRELQRLGSRVPVPTPAVCLHELFELQAARTPDAVAVVDGDRQVSYAELDVVATDVSLALRASGVGPDVPVGIILDRSVDMVAALLGILKAGGAYLPIETDTSSDRIAQLLGNVRARLCIARPDIASAIDGAGCEVVTMRGLSGRKMPDGPMSPVAGQQHLCAVYYTSGSTGRPKAIACTHAGWVNRMLWMQRRHGLRCEDAVLHKTTLTFDDAAVEIFWPLAVGGTVALLAPGQQGDPRAIIDAAIRDKAVHLQFVPSVLDLFLETITEPDLARLGALRSVISSGDVLRPATVQRFFETFPSEVTLDNSWGPTEVSIDATCHGCTLEDATDVSTSVGTAVDNIEVHILDDTLDPVPIGVPGEIYLAGIGLARCYLGDPGRTADAFVPHVSRVGERMYRTGDRGRWLSNGSVQFLGRRDHQVKIRGVRIELGEIEAALYGREDVADAAVTTWEASPGDKRIAAYVVPAPGADVTVTALREFLATKLSAYAMPGAIRILDALPRTPSGKLDRQAIRHVDAQAVDTTKYLAPRTVTEQALAVIWSELLQVEVLGVEDNFFAAGGHSLLAIRAVNSMQQHFNTEMPLRIIFECPTIVSASSRIEELVRAEIEAMSEDEVARLNSPQGRE
jgi:amino acid adenylation domain-containing protein